MKILINPTEVELKPIEVSPLIGYAPIGMLEARDKDDNLIALLTMRYTKDDSILTMNYFEKTYEVSLLGVKEPEQVIEHLLNQVNLTIRKHD